MTHIWHQWAVQDGPGWWLNNSCNPTRHITDAKLWPTEQEATDAAATFARLNGGHTFTAQKMTLSQPPLSPAGYPTEKTAISNIPNQTED